MSSRRKSRGASATFPPKPGGHLCDQRPDEFFVDAQRDPLWIPSRIEVPDPVADPSKRSSLKGSKRTCGARRLSHRESSLKLTWTRW